VILRTRSGEHYRVPAGEQAQIFVEDPNSKTVLQKNFTLSNLGTIHGELDLPADAALGYYSISVRGPRGEQYAATGGFHVEEYKKPEYQVTVTPLKQRVLQGDVIEATIEARYFFGEPVTGANVKYVVHTSSYWSPFIARDEQETGGGGEEFEGEGGEGGEAYANRGTPKNGGTRLLCVAGHVNKPGIYEIPLGMNMKKFIYEMAGGIPGNKKIKAVIPGGSSCPLMTGDEIDVAMDYDSVAKAGSMLGSGGMVVMDEDTCMVDMARRIMHFYAHESCGWCIPCREGTSWLRKTLERFHAGFGRPEDIDLIADLAKNMLGRTFCPLGDAAAMPTISIMKKWRGEFEEHLKGRCPYKPAEALAGAR